MGVEAKLFVTVGKDKLFEVVDSVVDGLNIFVRNELDTYWKNNTDAVNRAHFLGGEDYKAQSEMFTNGVNITCYNLDVLRINFGIGEEYRRMINVCPDCSCDYSDTYKGEKIIFSISHWGEYDEIMKVIAQSLSEFGDVYYDHNDCDDEDFIKLY